MKTDIHRSCFPVTQDYIFLNHAAASPVSLKVVKAVTDFYNENANQGSREYFNWIKRVEAVRRSAASIINADSDEIAFTGNTSEGISIIASGFNWKKKDEVIIPVPDFPSNVYPWLNLKKKGVQVNFVQRQNGCINLKDIEKKMTPRTRMIALSSVDYLSGFAANLPELGNFCKKKGIFLFVDAIQSLGVIPLDVKECGIHFLSAGGHKWLTGPMGIGILFINKQVNDLLTPFNLGWKSVINEEDFNIDFTLKKNALQFEPGTMNISGIFGLGAALNLLKEIGIPNIYYKVLRLNDIFRKHLDERGLHIISPSNRENRSGILSFKPWNDPVKCYNFLISKKIMLSLRNGSIRISPHFYNNEDDISAFFRIFDELRL